jgi:probable addiction module antidote protein
LPETHRLSDRLAAMPGLYKALSTEGNPEFATVLKVMRALGLKLKVAV